MIPQHKRLDRRYKRIERDKDATVAMDICNLVFETVIFDGGRVGESGTPNKVHDVCLFPLWNMSRV